MPKNPSPRSQPATPPAAPPDPVAEAIAAVRARVLKIPDLVDVPRIARLRERAERLEEVEARLGQQLDVAEKKLAAAGGLDRVEQLLAGDASVTGVEHLRVEVAQHRSDLARVSNAMESTSRQLERAERQEGSTLTSRHMDAAQRQLEAATLDLLGKLAEIAQADMETRFMLRARGLPIDHGSLRYLPLPTTVEFQRWGVHGKFAKRATPELMGGLYPNSLAKKWAQCVAAESGIALPEVFSWGPQDAAVSAPAETEEAEPLLEVADEEEGVEVLEYVDEDEDEAGEPVH